MSLIDEALKRARQEAERREVVQRSAASRWVPSHPLSRRRPRALLWAGAAVVCLAAGVAVGLGVSALSGDAAADRERQATRQPAAAPSEEFKKDQVGKETGGAFLEDLVSEPPAGVATGVEGAIPSLPSQSPIAGSTAPAAPPPAAAGQEPSSLPGGLPATGGETPATPPPAAARRQPPSSPSPSPTVENAEPQGLPAPAEPPPPRGTVHVHRAPLPGGGSIELGGIAFSATQPVALLNGKVVGVGEIVDGMTVVAIHPKRVDLEGRGVALSILVE